MMNKMQESAPFFEELKKLRIERDIELSEVSTRTKISLEYLEAMESGDFTFLPYVYIRLFLKAYTVEIGAETEGILQQLDHLMDKKTPTEDLPPSEDDEESKELPEDGLVQSLLPSAIGDLPSSAVKVGVLIIVVFFGVWVVRQITNDESESMEPETGTPFIVAPKITDQELNSGFIPTDVDQELNLEAPYRLTLSSTRETWYEFESDYSGNITSASLLNGNDISMSFNEYLYLRLERTADVTVFLNGTEVFLLDAPYPTDIIYDGQRKQLLIRSYTPR
ncbi:MAG: helix-turn-helix domain-containing protein [Candidatus Marinimicrobia bacterium]|jgi:transcriptional regulator with XRE-family HTH domain|nr:helix-turn-helix domain-containing protein [Candidatus Neomarinimicrobiota bacterium]|tara:strand:+ start:4512 stop:5348 length:837 start_codon:yes stop_codon:yes gene_type:complete